MNNTLNPVYKYFLFIFLWLAPGSLFANFDFNANCLKAYRNIFELKLNAARQAIAAEKRLHPQNSIVPLLENYVDYFYLLTTENKADFDRLKAAKSRRLDQIEEDSEDSPYNLYAQAEINLQWALIRGKYGEYFTAAREIKKANALLQENSKKYPGFHLNSKGLGLINAVLGNLPDGILKSALSAFGLRGNLPAGMAMLNKLAEGMPRSAYRPFYQEVVFYYAYVLSDIAHSPLAYSKTMKFTEGIADTSLLKTYLRAYVCSKTGHTEEAIAILSNRPTGPGYQPFAYLDLLMGTAKLNKLDYAAATYFNRFLAENKGVNYIKDAYLRLGWIALLKGDTGSYMGYMSKVRNNGYRYDEKDKQALNEASAPRPKAGLLKARLLFDGGYLSEALEQLSNQGEYTTAKDRTELYYRFGRIYDGLGKEDNALSNFQKAVNTGKNLKYYFAANAALQMGKIYERKRNFPAAKRFYNTAINMKDHEDEDSIETQAKEGLNRIES